MRHTEADRKAFWADEAAKKSRRAIRKWLQDNPRVGALNSGSYYVVVDGVPYDVEPLADVTELLETLGG